MRRDRPLHEAAHKLDPAHKADAAAVRDGVQPDRTLARGGTPSLNDAAHKLEHWVPPTSAHDEQPDTEAVQRRFAELADDRRDVVTQASRAALALGALGVVYGDIGTSPLYTEQAIFTNYHATSHVAAATVFGAASLIFWALMVVVSIKYAGFIMRAHNRGDGGIMALTALLQRKRIGRTAILVTLGIFGAGLFFGDGMITPAISVTSAVGGLGVVSPGLSHLVVPLSLGILVGLFALQRFGTGAVGWLFGPVILVWFAAIGILGGREVAAHPAVLQGLS